jgi:hypothetical protein
MVALLLLQGRSAQAGNTTVVVSVSVGGGLAIGAVGWYLYLTYSEQVAHHQRQKESVSMRTMAHTDRMDLGLDGDRTELIKQNQGLIQRPGVLDQEDVPSSQVVFVRFLELPW